MAGSEGSCQDKLLPTLSTFSKVVIFSPNFGITWLILLGDTEEKILKEAMWKQDRGYIKDRRLY